MLAARRKGCNVLDFKGSRQRAFDRVSKCYSARITHRSERSSQEGCIEKWRVEVELVAGAEVEVLRLEVRLPYDFPLSLPRIYLQGNDLERLLPLPHVNASGFVCTFDPETTTPNSEAPAEIALRCIRRATSIIKAGLEGTNHGDFETEFFAYWSDGDVQRGISLIPEDGSLTDQVHYMRLDDAFGMFKHVLHVGGQTAENLKAHLKDRGLGFSEQEAFYAGYLPIATPPFDLSNGEAASLIGEQGDGVLADFERYVNRCGSAQQPVVVFSKQLGERVVHQAWLHRAPNTDRDGFRKGKLKPFKTLHTFERSRRVERLHAEAFTPERLRRRSASDDLAAGPSLSVLIAGLGSIGSHLTQLLRSGPVRAFHFIDPDGLSVENAGRHVLGLSHVGTNKAVAMGRFVRDADPTMTVGITADKSLVEAVENEPQHFENADCAFIAIGNTPSELWYDAAILSRVISTPTFFLWVEPYLAGGHCVYINPDDERSLAGLFDAGHYRFNVLTREAYESHTFTKRESGCQSTYVPYSSSSVALFLASLLPEIMRVLCDLPAAASCRMTWTGDLGSLSKMDLSISPRAEERGSGRLITRTL
jgi:hypothetical protein